MLVVVVKVLRVCLSLFGILCFFFVLCLVSIYMVSGVVCDLHWVGYAQGIRVFGVLVGIA